MGSTIIAKCPCGFESDNLYVGCGFDDVGGKCFAPALSKRTGKLILRDYWNPQKSTRPSRRIIFYNDPELQEQTPVDANSPEEAPEVFTWYGGSKDQPSFYLPDVYYLCPSCGEMKMRFMEGLLMWD